MCYYLENKTKHVPKQGVNHCDPLCNHTVYTEWQKKFY